MMKMTIAFLATIAACSSGTSAKPTAVPANPDPVPMKETPPPPAMPRVVETPPPQPDSAPSDADLLATETAAYERAKPVFEKYCAKCHTRGGKLSTEKKRDHFDMTTYPFGGHHAKEIGKQIRKALGITGNKPTMPFDKIGAVKGDDLAVIAAWADAFDASHAREAHDGHGDHDHGDHDHGDKDHKH